MRSIRIERVYRYPRLMVWEAIANREALADWLMPNDFEPVQGHEFTFRTKPAPGFDGIVRAKVLDLATPERLILAWRGGPLDTRLCFELQEVSAGETRLILTHEGFRGLSNLMPRIFLGFGWKDLLGKKLPAFIERNGGT
ncbi:MAG: SRPBCC domain-containing protein [Methylobacterium sp.]|jgi:uncharacterized protein YndB with AHSA1/START domain|nr:SRPBCC domain-containing protein [Methylobacterium sp.]MCA3637380.1 SRPBCC domain-containing protein [Methylobacterium sp.]MCA3641926.1 SRPBCC domain-containing protein [Methylobacterium sp.]